MAENQETEEINSAGQADIAPTEPHKKTVGSRFLRLKVWYLDRKKWTVPATVLLLIAVLAAVPFTRYNIAGLALKHDVSIKVTDATAGTPVSGATVSVGSISAQTDGTGQTVLRHVKVGHHKALITKKYYKDRTVDVLSPILSQKHQPAISLTATGRQVKITVTNLINKTAVQGVNIQIAGTTAKTDQTGSATVVLPPNATEQPATLKLDGYNDAKVTVKVSGDKIQDNPFSLTPAGKLYFLSKLSGKIDVVKTNLDSTNRQTIVAGTGNEDDRNTVLLASRDWKYLALLSRRAGANPSLYLISTADDSLTVIDSGSVDFSLTGWAGDNFVYTVTNGSIQLWDQARQVIKSYNAQTKKSVTLDQTTASGTNNSDYLSQLVGSVYAYDDQVFYIINWTSSFSGPSQAQLASKQATFNSVKPDGTAKKAIRSFGLASGTTALDVTVDERIKGPNATELHFSDGTQDSFFTYANGQVKPDTSQTTDNFYGAIYPTYLLSPSGSKTFWTEPRDGKNTLFVGDENGQNGTQIATLSDYNTYGWYTDEYLLVSKNSSELYITDKAAKQSAVKVSDYHKPALTFNGYGGGYGGL
jgi:hypothetical protein